jgi:hypothetical protein
VKIESGSNKITAQAGRSFDMATTYPIRMQIPSHPLFVPFRGTRHIGVAGPIALG